MKGKDKEKLDEEDWTDPTVITQITPRPAKATPPPDPGPEIIIEDYDENISEIDVEALPELVEIVDLAPIDHEQPGGPAFVVLEPDQPPRVFWVHDDLVLGRGADVHIPIPTPSVSRKHAAILRTAEGCVLEDLISDNGTYVNGERIERKVLWPGDTIRIATVELTFLGYSAEEQRYEDRPAAELRRYEWQLPPGAESDTMMLDQRLMERMVRVRNLLARGAIRTKQGEGVWKPGHDRLYFGGDDGIPISALGSGRAAVISWSGNGHHLHRLARWTKVRVNDEIVSEKNLEPGDEIKVGGSEFLYALD